MTLPSCHRLVDEYLTARRGLGFDLETAEGLLRDFASHADRIGHDGPVTIELAVQWARSSRSGKPAQAARRLAVVRQFARYRALFDPATEVPPVGLLGRIPRRSMPHIYSEAEVAALLQQASCLLPRPRAATRHLCRVLRPAGLDRPAALRGQPPHDRRRRPRQRHPDHPRDQVPQVPTRPAPSDYDPGTGPLRRSPRRVSCCTSVRVILPHRAFAPAHAHRRGDDIPPDQTAPGLDHARAHAPTPHPRPAPLFGDPDYSESASCRWWESRRFNVLRGATVFDIPE